MLVPEPHDLRASDAERERVAQALQAHAAAGRLDPEELDERLELAYTAARRADLAPLVADLPELAPPAPPGAAAASAAAAGAATSGAALPRSRPPALPVASLLAVAVLLVAIWALTGGGYFWPVWPIGAMALHGFKSGRWRAGHASAGFARR